MDAANDARSSGLDVSWRPAVQAEYRAAARAEEGREKTDEPYLLSPVDAAFCDEHGRLLPFEKIAAIIRDRFRAEAIE